MCVCFQTTVSFWVLIMGKADNFTCIFNVCRRIIHFCQVQADLSSPVQVFQNVAVSLSHIIISKVVRYRQVSILSVCRTLKEKCTG